MSKADTLNPIRQVQIGDETVTVRELTWKEYLHVIRELTSTVFTFITDKGAIEWKKDRIVDALMKQEGLLDWVLQKSTDRPGEWVASLKATHMLRLLEAIIDLNLNEDIVGRGKAVAGRIGQVISWKNVSSELSTTSSAPATPSKTSKA